MHKLTEKLIRTHVRSINDVTDKHVRPLTFEEIVLDPRHGIVYSVHEMLKELKEFLIIKQPNDVGDIYNLLDDAIKDGPYAK